MCRNLRLRSTMLMLVISLVTVAVNSKAQTITGSISGVVTDSTGSVVPAAAVMLANEKTGQTRNASTNGEGRFNFAALQPGSYSIKIERQGFQTVEQRNIILSANENLALGDLRLQPGQVTETVSITESP